MKLTLSLIAVTAFSLLMSVFWFTKFQSERDNRVRIDNNFNVLASEFYNFKDSMSVGTGILNMSVNEVKKAFPALENSLKSEFNIKLKNVSQVTQTQTVVNHTFKTTVKDSMKLDTIPFKYMAYKEQFFDFEAQEINNELFVTKNIVTVPLTQIVSKEAWKIKNLFPWNWNKRQLIQDVKSSNPHAIIEFSRTIEIKK